MTRAPNTSTVSECKTSTINMRTTRSFDTFKENMLRLMKTMVRIIRGHVWMQITLVILGCCFVQRVLETIDTMCSEIYYILTIYPMLGCCCSLLTQSFSLIYYIVTVYPVPTAVCCSLFCEYPYVFKYGVFNITHHAVKFVLKK